jgi:hypothetical protein
MRFSGLLFSVLLFTACHPLPAGQPYSVDDDCEPATGMVWRTVPSQQRTLVWRTVPSDRSTYVWRSVPSRPSTSVWRSQPEERVIVRSAAPYAPSGDCEADASEYSEYTVRAGEPADVCEQPPAHEYAVRSEPAMVQERRTRLETYTVRVPVEKRVVEEYTVSVPHTERRIRMQTVRETVPVQRTRTIREDHGCWSRVEGRAEKVWVPKIVERQVAETVHAVRDVEQPCYYDATVYRPETRQRTKVVTDYEEQLRTREVEYAVDVPRARAFTESTPAYRVLPRTSQTIQHLAPPGTSLVEPAAALARRVSPAYPAYLPTVPYYVPAGRLVW